MKINTTTAPFIVSIASLAMLFTSAASFAKTDNPIEFSGFARVVLGYLDEEHATYLGYDDGLSLDQQSLIGLQADYQILDNVSFTGQFVGHTGDERTSGIEWLYLTYQPTRASKIRLGRQRTPFFNFSDSIDVGFAYPWITLPQQVYNTIFFSTFDGVLANYQWSGKELEIDVEGYWGSFNDTIYTGGSEVTANVNDLHGLVVNVSFDNWTLRAASHTTDTFIGITDINQFSNTLAQLGFNQTAEVLNSNGKIEFNQLAASYENVDYFFRTEATKTIAESPVIPNIDSFFVAAGYNYYPFSTYLSFGKNKSTYDNAVNEIPIGYNAQLDTLAFTYQGIVNNLPLLSSQSITLGTRWDWKTNLALKWEVTWIKAEPNSSSNFDILNNSQFDRKSPLYQLALEWVF